MEKRYPPRERRTSRRILAENLRLIRLQRHIPQDELADIVGLDRSYLGGVERGTRNIALDNVDKIATALGVSVPQLLTEPDTSGIAAHLIEDIRCRIREERGDYCLSSVSVPHCPRLSAFHPLPMEKAIRQPIGGAPQG